MNTTKLHHLVLSATLAAVVGGALAGPAAAAPVSKLSKTQLLSATSCSAVAGTYASSTGTRTCTMVATVVTDGTPVVEQTGLTSVSWPGGGARHELVGTSLRRATVTTTTLRRQSGTRQATTTTTQEQTEVVVPVSCVERVTISKSGSVDPATGSRSEPSVSVTETAMPLPRCEMHQLFAA